MPFPAGPVAAAAAADGARAAAVIPACAPASRGRGRRCCGDAVGLPAGGGAAGHRRPWLLGGGDGTTDTTYSPSSPQRGAAAPLAGRAALGVAPAVTGRGPRPPLPRLCPRVCLTGLLPRPPPRRPPEPAAVSAGGSGERGFRRPGIGRRDDRLLAAEARCEARVGFLCLREWVCGGWGGGVYVCLFWFCPSPYRFFAARVRGRVKQSRGRRLRPLGRLSGECRRQLHFSLAASEGRVVSLLGFCRRFCETVACLSKIKPFIFPQTTLIVFCDRISVSFPSLSLPLSLWLMQWSEESCS